MFRFPRFRNPSLPCSPLRTTLIRGPRPFITAHVPLLPPRSNYSTEPPRRKLALRENIYTLPNLLTTSRILACPAIGWSILQGQFDLATSLLVYAGLTDLADGWIARRFKMNSVLGTILDPAADKALMTTLTVTLSMKGMLPIPLAVLILGRDVLLSLAAFYIRYTSLPPPKTFSRYWDFGIPSAEVHPTGISKVNTGLQLFLMGTTTISPLLPWAIDVPLTGLQWIVATTTIWSGISYVFAKDGYRVVAEQNSQDQKKTP
ncbi:CDP-alcohol phosphatidyltransferase-domain-containing protein [Lentinula raphanica]|uniref:CDP-alcohol phosphatidyltransferase-domain-containing protein n=1 Tax=Lentinula raphanica TaxID=153919 RepID=A0AA38UH85_9AGAR|nr:CDP-alcohol phosphatidyltransferase-domain-containing protein [Lentinula raphanica]KAJ3771593.1 CDP-alcohol phosphatidyltransferase-domain-containing protein [Lentinula raphanica]KAJ3821217.1 CDP-alcohol phosphatidyltransferase-domain-containing protein [Lentinula raphanica]KAJ3840991.1 CDP-alcohol phosphatidyltransferase-domain-containing protein [Lentinula raphanica]KAJ3967167.1 CDP-alcohol phosphatidyltransferase-domain-containing protein [Lentinula raphanica]